MAAEEFCALNLLISHLLTLVCFVPPASLVANIFSQMVAVDMTHSNLNRRMAEIRFDLHMTIWDVKMKISTHCGTPAASQRLVLKDAGQPIAHMDDDSKMLGYYSVESGMEIHIIDTDPFSTITTKALEDVSQIEKYRMSDEAYDQRRGTVRQYIKEQKKLHGPNWKPPKMNPTGNPWMKQTPGSAAEKEEKPDVGPETVAGMEVGMRCEVSPGARRGEVMFVGEVEGLSGGGHWVGVKFDEPVGKSDGKVKGSAIFECEPGFGGFCRGFRVQVGDFPPEWEDSDEDEI